MNAFETTAVLEDASHLILRKPVPYPSGRECRVIVLFDSGDYASSAWPDRFFDEIRIEDKAFERAPQGGIPPVTTLD